MEILKRQAEIRPGSILNMQGMDIRFGSVLQKNSMYLIYNADIQYVRSRRKIKVKEFYPASINALFDITREKISQKMVVAGDTKLNPKYIAEKERFNSDILKLKKFSNKKLIDVIYPGCGNENYTFGDGQYLLLDLGNGLNLDKCTSLSLKEKLKIIVNMVSIFKTLHTEDYFMIDFRPDNFVWENKSCTLRLSDIDNIVKIDELDVESILASDTQYSSEDFINFKRILEKYPGYFDSKKNMYISFKENVYNIGVFMKRFLGEALEDEFADLTDCIDKIVKVIRMATKMDSDYNFEKMQADLSDVISII